MLHARDHLAALDGRRRLIGIGGVALVHLLILSVILSGMPKVMPMPRAAREMLIALLPKPEPRKKVLPRHKASLPALRRPARLPDFTSVPAVAPPSAPATGTLDIPLFTCAPEKFAGLSPEAQARCAGIGITQQPQTAIVDLRSHVRDPARRAEELVARRTPVRVSCTHAKTESIQNTIQQHSLIVDPVCAAGVLLRAARR